MSITADDVANKQNLKMVLAFDPDYMLNAFSVHTGNSEPGDRPSGAIDKTNGVNFSADFLNFAPVIARENETIMRETYLLKLPTAVSDLQPHDMLLNLYYVKEDEEKGIRAVTTNWMYNDASAFYINSDPLGQIYTTSKNADGTYNFLSNSGVKLLQNFKRESDKSKTFNVTSVSCPGATDTAAASGCAVNVISKTYTAQRLADVEVNAEGSIAYATPEPTATPDSE